MSGATGCRIFMLEKDDDPMSMLEGKAVVITGAGAGLGAAYARQAASLGASLVVNDINAGNAASIVAEINAGGGQAVAWPGDISSWEFAGTLIQACIDAFGRIDALVNNAVILRHGRLTELKEADLRRMLEINTIGTAACASHAVHAMLKQETPATIINVASGSQAGDIAIGGYGASKAAVASLTYTWAMELRDTNVRVNAISPLAQTAMAQSNMGFLAQQSANREVEYTTLPAAELSAPVVSFLISDASIGVNGQVVRIAGRQLSLVTHPMIADPVLEGDWTPEAVEQAFRQSLSEKQCKLGLAFQQQIQ